jgi:uncharacterized protein with PIN domain
MEYTVEYEIAGCISVEASSQEEANKIVHEMDIKEVLDKSDTHMMTIKDSRYCVTCDKEVGYSVKEEKVKDTVKGFEIEYVASIAICDICGEEIYVPELSDMNVRRANEAYREKSGE